MKTAIVWMPIGESRYQISNNGQVLGVRGTILRPSQSGNGYLYVSLALGGKTQKHAYIHRLVAGAFLPNPDNHPVVNHKDHDRSNNKVENLEWASHKDNAADRARTAHRVRKVIQLTREGAAVREWSSMAEAEEELGVWKNGIWMCCSGRAHSAGGWVWKYAPEPDLPDEIWCPVDDYQVSSCGRIRIKGDSITMGSPNGVYLSFRGQMVHRLVAAAFRYRPEGKDYVNHIDQNPRNNAASNLEWVTAAENNAHSVAARPQRNYQTRAVETIEGDQWVRFASVAEAAAVVNVTSAAICSACQGRSKTAGGRIWRYCDPASLADGQRPVALDTGAIKIENDDPLWVELGG